MMRWFFKVFTHFGQKRKKNWRCFDSIPGRTIAIAAAAAAAVLLRPPPPPAAMRRRGGRHILKKGLCFGTQFEKYLLG